MRWTASGGFAWPEGYLQKYQDHVKNSRGPIGGGLPELDWFVLAHWNHEKKEWHLVAPKFLGKRGWSSALLYRRELDDIAKRQYTQPGRQGRLNNQTKDRSVFMDFESGIRNGHALLPIA
jgi:hypothetical protein